MTYQQLQNLGQKGKPVFDSVPENDRPKWALNFLGLIDNEISNQPKPVKELYDIVEDESKWYKAYDQFQKIRAFSLSHPDFEPKEYLILAERIAKVTYNQTKPNTPFDRDSGWAIPYLALEIPKKWNDQALESQLIEWIEVK